MLVSGVQYIDSTILYITVLITKSVVTSATIQHYNNFIDYILYAVLFIYVTYLLYKWKYVPLNPFMSPLPLYSSVLFLKFHV